ncbi:AlpA family phage regulatory protein [Variovorax sp. efr-133-TYG-130]|uniref:helix-turn-helix transcriptional regulator n=1 Tax=Variovorax sp. efr-133-TYG-130 TaxID=3040327 RepID=UPI0025554E10|nr:AlpA family phage regulatory protein [Variovorax sp. efr-133-TYG-130]
MNAPSLSPPTDQQSDAPPRSGLQARIVDLPDKDFLSCSELTFSIADALVGRIEEMSPSSETRVAWTDEFVSRRLYPRSYSARQMIMQRRREEVAALSNEVLKPLISPRRERWLDTCAHRLKDLQDWVTREKLQIFTAARTQALSPAPGTYLRRADAVRYCLKSGFEIRKLTVTDTKTSQSTPTTSVAVELSLPTERPAAAKFGARLLRAKEAISRTGLSRSTFYERQNPKSQYFDATFPSPVQIGQSAMGYREDELDAWIASRPEKKR